MSEMIEPCPFCDAKMIRSAQHFSHPEHADGDPLYCPLADQAWRSELVAAWNKRSAYNPNERLREALEPFAEKAEYADALSADDDDYLDCAPFKAGDYRRARSALSPLPQGEDT